MSVALDSVDVSARRSASPDRSVRPALPADAEQIARIHFAAMRALVAGFSDVALPPVEAIAAQWRSTVETPRPQGCHTLVALHGYGVAGFASCAPAEAIGPVAGRQEGIPAGTEVLNLWVDPAFARSGHGSRLLAAVADVTAAQSLRVWLAAGDEQRIRFFRSAGFAPAGLRRSLRVDEGATLVEHLWWALRI